MDSRYNYSITLCGSSFEKKTLIKKSFFFIGNESLRSKKDKEDTGSSLVDGKTIFGPCVLFA